MIAKPADLSLAMKGPADLNVKILSEAKLSYTITVTNAGPGVAAAIAVSDTLPSGTQFVSASVGGGTCQTPPVGSGGWSLARSERCRVGRVRPWPWSSKCVPLC